MTVVVRTTLCVHRKTIKNNKPERQWVVAEVSLICINADTAVSSCIILNLYIFKYYILYWVRSKIQLVQQCNRNGRMLNNRLRSFNHTHYSTIQGVNNSFLKHVYCFKNVSWLKFEKNLQVLYLNVIFVVIFTENNVERCFSLILWFFVISYRTKTTISKQNV